MHKRFGETVALEDVTLEFPAGSFVVLLGPSGSGKTTLLNILGGFLGPTSGEVRIGGESVLHLPPAERPTATVFQDYALFPHMNVMNNVAFGLAMQGVAKAERKERSADMLELVGLADFGKRSIHELSGGQKQRVALARSLVTEPQVLLLDEPLGALDLNLRKQMQRELTTIQKRVGTTFIHVTHDQEEALSLADLVVLMNTGRVEDVGAPKRLYLEPTTRFAATFMGESNLITGTVKEVVETSGDEAEVRVETALGTFELTVPTEQLEQNSCLLSLRPEHISTEAREGSLELGEAVLEHQHFLGTHYQAKFTHDSGERLNVTLPPHLGLKVGESYPLFAAKDNLIVLTDSSSEES